MDSIIGTSIIFRDTVSVMRTDQIVYFYSDMMDKQATQFGYLLTAIVAIFTVLLGVSWYWNTMGLKKMVNNKIDSARKTMQEDINTWKESTKEEINSQISYKVKEINTTVHQNLKRHEAELDRLYGVSCADSNNYLSAAEWLFSAFVIYHELGMGKSMELSLKGAVASLKSCLSSDNKNDREIERLDKIEKMINGIPDIYASKKKEANALVKQIRDKFI